MPEVVMDKKENEHWFMIESITGDQVSCLHEDKSVILSKEKVTYAINSLYGYPIYLTIGLYLLINVAKQNAITGVSLIPQS